MTHRFVKPSPHLQYYVREYLILDFSFDRNVPVHPKPFPARSNQCLIFYPKGFITQIDFESKQPSTLAKVVINGQQISRTDFVASRELMMIEVTFQPGVLAKFLRLPLGEFLNQNIDAEAVLGPVVRYIHERLANAANHEQMIRIVEEFLWTQIQSFKEDIKPFDSVLRMMVDSQHSLSVEALASDACLSFSQFDRQFAQQMGTTPKLFLRIVRFYRAYRMKDENPDLDWLSIAIKCNYHDYQHLVRDFKQFSGTTPNSLLRAQAHAPERILNLG